MSDTHQLKRGLKNRHVQLLAIGGAIGTGLFLGSGRAIHLAGPSIIFAYLITGIICFIYYRVDILVLLAITSHGRFNSRRPLYAVLDTVATSMDTRPCRLSGIAINELNSRKILR